MAAEFKAQTVRGVPDSDRGIDTGPGDKAAALYANGGYGVN
jgi:hypothetical protein